ncbi:hypothetical protein SAMN05216223_11417 [Actinacidiphila yanglinensis]|uniref:Uncharacterized protein n=1 Tax=Actinacidiphila yanglinensis TaxID=310779 RepID=A0A1H6DDP6_9ACTN|nr:hypothetical protein SAMN05216223_11417 [Actinacidiphila yanglinensis]
MIAEELPLFTANRDEYKGLDGLLPSYPSPGPPSSTTGSVCSPHRIRTMHSGTTRSTAGANGSGPEGTSGSGTYR